MRRQMLTSSEGQACMSVMLTLLVAQVQEEKEGVMYASVRCAFDDAPGPSKCARTK